MQCNNMLGKAPVCLLIRLVKNQVDQIKPEKATILETDASHKLFLKTTQFLTSIGGQMPCIYPSGDVYHFHY